MATFSNLFQTNTCSNQKILAIPNQRTFQKLTPLRVKFQYPQRSCLKLKVQSPAELKLPIPKQSEDSHSQLLIEYSNILQ